MKITRGELGNLLSATMCTRTFHSPEYDNYGDVQDSWIVTYMYMDTQNVLCILCQPPQATPEYIGRRRGGKCQ
jgi:hypothetical protein